ncbi:hypothetical protein EVAR_31143_1 [Eumeta japonica]|uniref:Uncharacterized protein n=1 Tax=Eumeta variegata TaxID=151549 RepID=A0A4C1VFW8_EUMVA|nr:hypothetical protein EVAR_31143_1 [Eumeta japonica]
MSGEWEQRVTTFIDQRWRREEHKRLRARYAVFLKGVKAIGRFYRSIRRYGIHRRRVRSPTTTYCDGRVRVSDRSDFELLAKTKAPPKATVARSRGFGGRESEWPPFDGSYRRKRVGGEKFNSRE